MTRDEVDEFVAAWIAAWNRRDVEAVVARFSDGVEFTSRVAAEVTGNATLQGKEQVRQYWLDALEHITGVRFTLDYAIWDPARSEVAIVFDREVDGRRARACELLQFDESGLIVRGEGLRGAEL